MVVWLTAIHLSLILGFFRVYSDFCQHRGAKIHMPAVILSTSDVVHGKALKITKATCVLYGEKKKNFPKILICSISGRQKFRHKILLHLRILSSAVHSGFCFERTSRIFVFCPFSHEKTIGLIWLVATVRRRRPKRAELPPDLYKHGRAKH